MPAGAHHAFPGLPGARRAPSGPLSRASCTVCVRPAL